LCSSLSVGSSPASVTLGRSRSPAWMGRRASPSPLAATSSSPRCSATRSPRSRPAVRGHAPSSRPPRRPTWSSSAAPSTPPPACSARAEPPETAPSSRTSTAPAAETARSTDAETPVQPVGGTGVSCGASAVDSDVVVQLELVGVRAEAERIDLRGALELDPGRDEVLGEHVALGEVVVVRLERVQRRAEGLGQLLDLRVLLRR